MFKFNNGDQVECKVTGFTGTVTGLCKYLNGCMRCMVQPRVGEDGKHPDPKWIDQGQLRRVDSGHQEENQMFKFNNGDRVECKVTGFTGTITGLAKYMNGCMRCMVQPRVGEDGKHPDPEWIDQGQLRRVDSGSGFWHDPSLEQAVVGGPARKDPPRL